MKIYKKGDTITYSEAKELTVNSNNLKFVKRTLQKGNKVFIDVRSSIPRKKFKMDFPDNPIVHDIDEADIVIGSDSYSYAGYLDEIFVKPGHYRWQNDALLAEVILKSKDVEKINKWVKIKAICSTDKPIIKDTDIFYKGEIPRIMKDEEYESISKMLGSGDVEMLNLGMEILLGFDHTINEKSYVLLLNQVKMTYRVKKGRTFKSILKHLRERYVNLRC